MKGWRRVARRLTRNWVRGGGARASRGRGNRSLGLAAALSLALHGAALAAALWIGGGTPPAPARMAAIPLVMIEPPAQASAPGAPSPAPKAEAVPVKPTAPQAEPAPREAAAERPETRTLPSDIADTALPPAEQSSDAAPLRVAAPPRKPEAPAPQPAAPAPAAAPAQSAALQPDTDATMAGGADTKAKPPRYGLPGLANPAPAYPWLSRRNGEEGRVVVRVLVDASGRASDVALARSSGHARLDRAALKTLREWRFAPAERAGRATMGTVEVPVTFKLTER